MAWGPKDPDAIRDYGVDWTDDIGGIAITSSTWTIVEGDVVNDDDSHDASTTTIRLSGGTAGETCLLRNHIVLANGEEDERTFKLKVKEL